MEILHSSKRNEFLEKSGRIIETRHRSIEKENVSSIESSDRTPLDLIAISSNRSVVPRTLPTPLELAKENAEHRAPFSKTWPPPSGGRERFFIVHSFGKRLVNIVSGA